MPEIKYENENGIQVETLASVVERLSSAFNLVSDDVKIIESRFCCWQFDEGQEYADCVWVKFKYSGDLYIASASWDEFDKLEMFECWN